MSIVDAKRSDDKTAPMNGKADGYPKRVKFFALRFCRLMAKVCLANEIGPEACWMLAVIAHTEDAKCYSDPVTFFNGQLMPLVGLSEDSLDRARRKAIDTGWLHYEPGRKKVAGRYWVQIPDRFKGIDDAPTDESGNDFSPELHPQTAGESSNFHPQTAGTSRVQAGYKPGENGIPLKSNYLTLSLSLESERRFKEFWKAYPKKQSKGAAEAEWNRLDPDATLCKRILEAIKRQSMSDDWNRGERWIPKPAKWLKDRGWEDETGTGEPRERTAAQIMADAQAINARRAARG